MSKVVHRHEVVKAAEDAFGERVRRLEAQIKLLESELEQLRSFVNNMSTTESLEFNRVNMELPQTTGSGTKFAGGD